MATTSKRDVTLGIAIETTGDAEVQRLAAEVRKLAREGDPAAAEFRALADQLDRLGEQVDSVQAIRALNADIDRLAASQVEAAAATKAAKDALEAQSTASAQLREQQRAAAQAVDDSTVRLKEARGAVRALGTDYDAAGKKTQEYRAELARLNAAVTAADVDLVKLRSSRAAANVAAAQAVNEESRLSAAYLRTRDAANAADLAVRDRATALRAAETAASGLALSTTDLAQADALLLDQQSRLVAQLNTLKAEQAERLALDKQAEAAAARLADQVRATATAYEQEQAALAESAAVSARAAAEKQRLAEAAEKAAAAERAEAAAAAALSARRNEQADADLLAARAASGLAEARARGALAAQSELAAIKDSEEFTRRYAQAQRDAAAAVEREGVEAMRLLEHSARAADKAQEQLIASLRETEQAAERYAVAVTRSAEAGEVDAEAMRERRAAAEALIASERNLTAEQREAVAIRDRNRGLLVAEAQALLAAARAADESRAATARLVQQTLALGTSVDKSSASIRQMGAITEQAFGQTGVRGLQSIEAEVRRVDLAISQLARDMQAGRISVADFDRAVGSATVKLAALKREAATIPALPGQFERLSQSVQSVISRFGALGAAVATVGVAVRPVIEATVALEQMRRALTTVTGSAEEAGRQIDFVRNVSQQAGQKFTEVGQSYAKFAASALQSGLTIKQTQEVFQSVALAAGNLGLSSDQAKRALEALSQIAAKGTVSMEELRQQLGDALPGVLPLLAKELGLTQAELVKVVEAGSLLAVEAIPAIGRSLQALGPQSGVVNGMVASWSRFINVVQQAGTTLVEGPLGQVAAAGLTALGGVIRDVSVAAVGASEAFKLFGLSTLAVFDALTPGGLKLKDLGKTLDEFAQQAGANIQKYKDVAYAGAEGTKKLESETAKLGGSLAKLALESQKTIDKAALQSQAADKVVEARKKEIETSGALASLAGDEAAARDAAAAATRRGAEAGEAAAAADLRVVEALRTARTALIEKAAAEGLSTDATKKAVEELDNKIIKATADVEKSQAQAAALRAGAVAADLNAAAARNNADRIGELRKAHEDAIVALELARVAIVNGAGSEQDATVAAEALAKAKGLLRDAIDDVTEALELQLKAMEADVKLAEAGIKLEIERQKNAVRSAELAGNEFKARQARLKIVEAELQLSNLASGAKRAEAEATLLAIATQEAELKSLGLLTPEKAIELEARRKVQLAAVLEAQATNESSEAKRKEYENLKLGLPARNAYTGAVERGTKAANDHTKSTDGNSGSLGRNASAAEKTAGAVDRLTAAQLRYNAAIKQAQQFGPGVTDGSGIAGIKDPRLTDVRQPGDTRELSTLGKASAGTADNSYLFQVLDRIDRGGSFGADDLKGLTALREATRTNAYYVSNSSIGSLRAGEYDAQAAKVQAAYEKALQASQRAKYGYDSAFGGYKGSTASKTVNVNLNVGGKTSTLAGSPADVNALLAALEAAQRTAGGP